MYVRASLANLLECIFSNVISQALEQHASFLKSFTEMKASMLHLSVKFRLSCNV